MKKAALAAGAVAAALAVLALAVRHRAEKRGVAPVAPASPVAAPQAEAPKEAPGFLYGRVTTLGGATYEGRLRWGGDQEAFWGETFNGRKAGNRWAALVPPERLSGERRPIELFGVEIGTRRSGVDLTRLFMARFGDVARIEASGKDVRVTLKSGTVHALDRFEASDFDDGVRVWDGTRGAVDLDSTVIRSIELLPAPPLAGAPGRVHGTVRTRQGAFTGFLQWNREKGVGSDELVGRAEGRDVRLRFDSLRSVVRRSSGRALVTRLDGGEVELDGTGSAGIASRGVYVEDGRYGRVLVSWEALERADLGDAGSGPAYGDFPPGRPLTGSVSVRGGRRLAGRLVFDLDESETTETLDAPLGGVDYSILFGRVASVVPAGGAKGEARVAKVVLHGGEELGLEPAGDLGERNGGMLVFVEGLPRPEYVPWADVAHVDFDRP